MRDVTPAPLQIRGALASDLEAIRRIYNDGIADRNATLDDAPKTSDDIAGWWALHTDRYAVLVAHVPPLAEIVGWASLNPYAHRCAYNGVADLSIYVARASRGIGVGAALLRALEERALRNDFHKIVLFTFTNNAAGQALYRGRGYREVGVFAEQGRLDGRFIDIMAMEKILGRLEAG